MKRVSIFFVMIALFLGMVGCGQPSPPPSYNLIISSIDGGLVTIPGEGTFGYNEGTVVDLVAQPDEGYLFYEWTGDITTISCQCHSTTVTMNDDYFITANFVKQYDLTISSTEKGSVTTPGEGTYTYYAGEVVNLVAEAEERYRFVNWIGDVNTIADPNAASTTITMNDDYSFTANFEDGDVVSDFTLPTMIGTDITLSELIGTPVVLNFWSISCYWCRKQLPYLENVAQQSGGQIKVIAVNMADNAASVQNFFGDYEPAMIIALDSTGEIFRDYSLKYENPRGFIPFTLFIDSEGIMKYKQTGAFLSEAHLWDTLHYVFEL